MPGGGRDRKEPLFCLTDCSALACCWHFLRRCFEGNQCIALPDHVILLYACSKGLAGSMQIPEINTPRLLLRRWLPTDFPNYASLSADPEVMKYLGGQVLDEQGAWRKMAYFIGHWELAGFGCWAVEEKATGEFIGRVGFNQPHGWPGFEIGWTLARGCWGKGYATEAASVLLEYAFTQMKKSRVISVIQPENLSSIAVARKLGESYQGTDVVKGIDVHIYGITKVDWQKRQREADFS